MTYYPDLSRCDYFGRWSNILVAVGWNDARQPFARGPVSGSFFSALVRALSTLWQPVVTAGYHGCVFCRFTGGPSQLAFDGSVVSLVNGNLFIPGKNCIYVSPAMVAHYIDAHEYCPPPEYQVAVENCPTVGSAAYLREIRALGMT
jgi:hypothetical protein